MAAISDGKKVCLITPGHIASNPRLVKEAIALSEANLNVHIIFTQYVDTLIAHDQQLLASHPLWTYDCLNWTNTFFSAKIVRFLSGIRQRFSNDIKLKLNRLFYWQLKKAIAIKADLYIAHNLGALPVAIIAAKKNKVKGGFDAEDFHRNEVSDEASNPDVLIKTVLENEFIPQADYITAASPLIAEKYSTLFNRSVTSILNAFPKTIVKAIKLQEIKPLQLFWFSQTVGPNRGLENTINAIVNSNIKAHLHLLGNVTDGYKNDLLVLATSPINSNLQLVFHSTIYPDDIFNLAAQCDIGLATEPTTPLNRDICLTNKIFTYLQSGLAIIASNTTAQKSFMHQYSRVGKLYNDVNELTKILIDYNQDRDLLLQTKVASFHLGQTEINWENEQRKFIVQVNVTLANL